MNRIWWLAPLLATLACGSNPSVIPAGDFSGPSGLAIAPLVDRDLLFIANQGSNELRAITLCTAPAGIASTCSPQEDQQLLPAPIRLLPGSILAGARPLRLAGARLTTAGGVPHGAVLVAGLEAIPGVIPRQDALRIVDAADLFAASQDKSKSAALPKFVPLTDVPVDVVASDAQGTSVAAVVATQPSAGGPGALTVLTVTVGPDGLAMGTATQQCALDFVPARLALVPGEAGPQRVYVADGTPGGTPGGVGDGAVEVSVPGIPAIGAAPLPACPTRRLPASDPADSPRLARPLRSLALSPTFTNPADGAPLAPGSLLLGVTSEDKALCTDHAPRTCPADLGVPAGTVCVDHGTRSCGRGRLVLISTNVGGQSAVLRAPPNALTASGAPPMVPLSPPSPASEVAFMVTGLRLFAGGVPTLLQPPPPLVGLASTEDGTTYLLDVVKRRFFSDSRDTGGVPPLPQFTLTPDPGVAAPTLQFAAADSNSPSKQVQGWLNPGVTRSAQWQVEWHGTIPRLESLSGNLSRAPGSPTISLRLTPGKSLAPWTSAPELQLGAPSACALPYPQCVGDFVRILSYSRSDTCAALGTVPAAVDVPIAAIGPDGQAMQLQAVSGFDPGPECFASEITAAVEVHAGTTTAGPWMVFEGPDVLGRLPTGAQFVVTGARFDYPLNPPDPPTPPPPSPARDVVVSFTMTGEPPAAGTFFSFTVQPFLNGSKITDSQTITGVRDATPRGQAGFAGPILVYSSARLGDPVFFTALTGEDAVLEAMPAQLGVANRAFIRLFY